MSTTNLDAFDADADHEAVRRSPHDPDGYTTSEARAEFRAGAAWGRWRTGADLDSLRDGIKAMSEFWSKAANLYRTDLQGAIDAAGKAETYEAAANDLRALLDGEAKG